MTHKPLVVGLTGGIGAGKSTCSTAARSAGIPIFDADAEADKIWSEEGFVFAVEKVVGPLGLAPKTKAAQMIARDPALLDVLYNIMAPLLRSSFRTFLLTHENTPVVILDAPLLLEKRWDEHCHAVAIIMADEEVRQKRVLGRPGMTPEKFKAITSRQVNDDERRARGTIFIDGLQTPDEVARQFLLQVKGLIDG